jgi:uncharacterized protein (DUF2235 family)
MVIYDQGIGTHPGLVRAVRAYANDSDERRSALHILQEPCKPAWMPKGLAQVLGLAVGYGLRDNVLQMYEVLSRNWRAGDKVFLIGFSRGAFTVRALAGLVYRCGLARPDVVDSPAFRKCAERAFELYAPHDENRAEIEDFKTKFGAADLCEVHFLGLWDTVKSYGGVWPISLPHLRHNPIVRKVRHALALHEKRSWFAPTSWGGIDSDDPDRLGVKPDPRYRTQDVQEVWFRGCHSDVGGGDAEATTALVPFHWMLREAEASGLKLSSSADRAREDYRLPASLEIHESLTCCWLIVEYFPPRWELDNSRRPPQRFFKIGRSGPRHVEQFARGGKLFVHHTAAQDYPVRCVKHV